MTSFKNLLVLSVALLIVSCNSDDDSINPFLDSDEEGFFSVNNDSMTILLNVDTYNVILFDESELRMTLEQTYSENNIDYIISREIRMLR